MELFTLFLFCIILAIFIFFNIELLYALLIGLIIFSVYALKKNFSIKEIFSMYIDGIKEAGNMTFIFFLIGILTSFWRASGTIAMLVTYMSSFIKPQIFLLMAFVLNSIVSIMTGTSFGTAATMGVVCATMGSAMKISPMLLGGAVMSGAFYGDRCSPVSTSALLVSEVTQTDFFDNIKRMIKTSIIPTIITCILYAVIGFKVSYKDVSIDLSQIFGQEFNLHFIALLPAFLILLLAAFRVPVKISMLFSILSAVLICVFIQNFSISQILNFAIFGFQAKDLEVAKMLNGGGIISMFQVILIIFLSSIFSKIFKKTGLLNGIKDYIYKAGKKITSFGAMLLTSILTSAVACNQTLGIVLTNQLCEDTEPDNVVRAINLENTVVLIASLIPWSIACVVPLSSIGAPTTSLLFAFYLYVLPLLELIVALSKKRKKQVFSDKDTSASTK